MQRVIQSVLLLVLVVGIDTAWADDDVTIRPDVVYGHKLGLAMTFDVFQPKQNANGAGVLFMVSGGWYSRWTPPERAKNFYKPLWEKGFTVFAVRHGSSPKFTIPEAVADVRRSVRFIRLNAWRFGIDADRLGVYGGSAGGHLSLVLGTTSDAGNAQAKDEVLRVSSRVAAVVAFYPPTDIRPMVQPESNYYKRFPALRFKLDLADDFSPVLHVSQDDPPTLLIHGDKDKLVPIDHSQKILAAFHEQHVTAELVVIEGAAHGFRGADRSRASGLLVRWFEKHLAKETAKGSD
jgi:acetyl esterase/lipase